MAGCLVLELLILSKALALRLPGEAFYSVLAFSNTSLEELEFIFLDNLLLKSALEVFDLVSYS